jgi:hypothetical protein
MCSRLYGKRKTIVGPQHPNLRLGRQPPTIVTWAELHFYDLPLIRPSGFVNGAALGGELFARPAKCQQWALDRSFGHCSGLIADTFIHSNRESGTARFDPGSQSSPGVLVVPLQNNFIRFPRLAESGQGGFSVASTHDLNLEQQARRELTS